jgi:hypothetical protein
MDALKYIPDVEAPLLTEQGEARLQKTDIFRKIMWFGYKEDNNWYPLNVDRVNEILALNKEGKKPATLQIDKEEVRAPLSVLNSDLASMDRKFKNKANKNNDRRGRGRDDRGNRDTRSNNQVREGNSPKPTQQKPPGGNPNKPNSDQNPNRNRNQNNPNRNNPNRNQNPNRNPNNPNSNRNQNNPNRNPNNPNRNQNKSKPDKDKPLD